MHFQTSFAIKTNNIFKYVLPIFGLSISSPQRRYCRWLLLITFILGLSCQLIVFIDIVFTISVYLSLTKFDVEDILTSLSHILIIPPAFFTYIYFYCRRFAISSVLQKFSDLSSSKTFTKNQWREQICQTFLFTLLNLILIIAGLTTSINNQQFIEGGCITRLIFEKYCKDPSTLAKLKIYFIVEIVFFNVFSHLFLSTIYCVFSHICTLLVSHFQQMDDKINRIINTKRIIISSDELSEFVKKILAGEKIANEVSRIFSPILLIWWFNIVVRICLLLRIFVYAWSGKFGGLIELLIEILRIYVLYKSVSDINKKAKSVGENFTSLKLADGFRNNNFYFHLLSTQVGINVSDLFLINSQTILTVMATIITYAVILFQTG
uniref:Gustatory receptor n=1 Tax=Strigamia maritima TaxID=126957 RepID=T1JKY2_STRMM